MSEQPIEKQGVSLDEQIAYLERMASPFTFNVSPEQAEIYRYIAASLKRLRELDQRVTTGFAGTTAQLPLRPIAHS